MSVIAVNQLVVSMAFLAVALLGSPLGMIFGLWGFVNACALFGSSALSRISALIWHVICAGFPLVKAIEHPPHSQPDNLIVWWAVVDLLFIFYLGKIILPYARARLQAKN